MDLVHTLFNGEKFNESIETLADKDKWMRRSINNRQSGDTGFVCSSCFHPVYLKKSTNGYIFASHYGLKRSHEIFDKSECALRFDGIRTEDCEHRKSEGKKSYPKDLVKPEGNAHIKCKNFIARMLEDDPIATDIKVEKRVTNGNGQYCQPDVQAMINGNLFAFEVQIRWLEPEVIARREAFYHGIGAKLVWVFYKGDIEYKINDEIRTLYVGTCDSVVSRVAIGSYLETYDMPSTVFTLTDNDISSYSGGGFKIRAEMQPYIRRGETYHAKFNDDGLPYLVSMKQPFVRLDDLSFIDSSPLPIAWKHNSNSKIASIFKRIYERAGICSASIDRIISTGTAYRSDIRNIAYNLNIIKSKTDKTDKLDLLFDLMSA